LSKNVEEPSPGTHVIPPEPSTICATIETEKHANIFCFGVCSDKNTGVMYTNLTRMFPHMSLDNNICFFVIYNYESNVILVQPVTGLDDQSILKAYKEKEKSNI